MKISRGSCPLNKSPLQATALYRLRSRAAIKKPSRHRIGASSWKQNGREKRKQMGAFVVWTDKKLKSSLRGWRKEVGKTQRL